ncbi:MATE family efflux transporter [uncultured Tyzzerella sp.]|uniref:MATE family efflux transporter n=1 Tax=uncultured Tyzzerella sp. TaxID=2321398 RepID=UPI0029427315|nr:MATE family efflux transporter [uncultured Tyzzerella sp.]
MTNDMTVGNPTKLVIKFIIPLLIGNIFQQLYSMVDTIIVGKYVGTQALAGVGSTGGINFFILGFAMGMTSGFAVPIAQGFGANDPKRVRHFVAMSIYLTVGIGIILTIISTIGLGPLLTVTKTPEDVYNHAYNYMIIILLGLITNMAYNMTASILRALGDAKTPLYFLIVASFLNIALDFLFILSFNMGVAGAALATVISQGVSAILCTIYMYKKFEILRMKKEDFIYKQKSANILFSIGFPMAFQYSVIAIGSILLQSAVNSLGTIAVASYTICCRIEQLAIQPFSTLGIAGTTYAGQNLGAGKIDRIKEGMKKMTIIGVVIAIICSVIIYVFNIPLINLFMQEGEDKTLVIEYVRLYLFWACAFFIPLMLLILYRSAIQGMGDAFFPLVAGIVELVGRVSVAIGLIGLGYLGISLACPVAWLGGALIVVPAYFRKLKNLEKNVCKR